MRPVDIARAMVEISDLAAQNSSALRRGNVESIDGSGNAIVVGRNGAKKRVRPTNLFEFGENQSITLSANGTALEVLSPSAYQGGNGAPFDAG